MVMAQTLFSLLKSQGNQHLSVLAPEWTLALAKRMPEVNNTVLGDFAHGQLAFGARKALGKSLRGQFDSSIVLPSSLKSALVPFFAKIPYRVGYIGECRFGFLTDARKLDKNLLPRTIDRFTYLATQTAKAIPEITLPHLNVDSDNQQRLRKQHDLHAPILAMCPGAEYGPSKQWPPDNFAKVAAHAICYGYQIIALGSGKDSALIANIRQHTPAIIDLAGKTSITDAIDLLDLSSVVVTNDSGLMHIAAAVNTHVIAIYGSTTPAMTPPLSKRASIFANDELDCHPCFKRTCPKKGNNFMRCMQATSADRIWQHIQNLHKRQ